jgi:membrane-associated phospholipid phosphatase
MDDHRYRALNSLRLPLGSWLFVPGAVLLFALTLAVGWVAKTSVGSGADLAAPIEMSEDRNPFLTATAFGIHYGLGPAGATLLLALICIWLMVLRREPLRALAFGSVTAVGWLSSEIGKFAVSRPRPSVGTVHALILETRPDSFPSGHTAFAASLAIAVALVIVTPGKQRWIAAVVGAAFVVVVALSRLFLGLHYPSDVIGSVLISCAGIMLWLPIWNNLIEPRLSRSEVLNRIASRGNRHVTVRS